MASAIHYGMTTIVSIDSVGRIVLPKALRDRFNLRPGRELELIAGSDHLELKPLDDTPSLVRSGSLWVHQGTARGPLGDAVRQMREDRIGELARKAVR